MVVYRISIFLFFGVLRAFASPCEARLRFTKEEIRYSMDAKYLSEQENRAVWRGIYPFCWKQICQVLYITDESERKQYLLSWRDNIFYQGNTAIQKRFFRNNLKIFFVKLSSWEIYVANPLKVAGEAKG